MAFGTFKVVAGDFMKGSNHQYTSKAFMMLGEGKFLKERIDVSQVEAIDVASEESVKRVGGTVGWGVAGAALLGPVGLLAGLIAGGRGKDVTFVCKFRDGRKFLGTAPSKVYGKMQADLF